MGNGILAWCDCCSTVRCQALQAYEERELPALREEKPGLKLRQYKAMIFEQVRERRRVAARPCRLGPSVWMLCTGEAERMEPMVAVSDVWLSGFSYAPCDHNLHARTRTRCALKVSWASARS